MLSYYDPAVMAPWIICPTVIGVTVGDLTVNSMGGLSVFKNLTALRDDEKWFLPGVNDSLHGGSAAAGILGRTLLEKMAGPLPAEPSLAGMEGWAAPK